MPRRVFGPRASTRGMDRAVERPAMPRARLPKLATFLAEAKAYHPDARSPHFARLAALRAEVLYGISAEEAYRRITGARRPSRDDEAVAELMRPPLDDVPPPWTRGRDPIDMVFDEAD